MEAAVVPMTAAASASHAVLEALSASLPPVPTLVPTWSVSAWIVAAGETEERTGSWFPWLAGFLPGALVVVVAYLVLRRIRRDR